jgi:diguanylate cyclase (GGDEF)-like protein
MTSPVDAGPPRPGDHRPRSSDGIAIAAVVAASYLLLAQFVIWLNDPVHLGAGFWPAGGLTVAALLLLPTARWRWVLAGAAAAELGGDLVHGYPLAAALWWTAGNCVGPLAGAWLIRRSSDPRGALVPMRNLLAFLVFGVVIGPIIGASLGSIGSIAVLGNPVWQVWPKYVIGDALGVLVLAPALLTWRAGPRRRSVPEQTVLVVVVLVIAPLVFRNWHAAWDVTLPYLIIPVLMWAALRFGMRGAAWSVLWVTQVANAATAVGYGPFARVGAPTGHAVTTLQLYLVVAAVTALIVAALVSDLSAHRQVEGSLRRQARTDALTGLPNRLHLSDCLGRALSGPAADRGEVALLMCDLDGFKTVNDGLGHQAGDEVLIEVARRLRGCLRSEDVAVRLSGDEFVLLVQGDEAALTSLIHRVLQVISEPIVLTAGQHVSVETSLGVAVAGPDHDPQTLLRDADAALYHAKARGRGRAERFDEALRVTARDRFTLPAELRAALATKRLHCLYQPEIDLVTGHLFGFEVLARWNHPERGSLLPAAFVPSAEATGLAPGLFDFVVDQALGDQQRWATHLGFHPHVSVNLSPHQLRDPSLPRAVAEALARWDAPPESLWLEVAESAVADVAAVPSLSALHDLGIHLAVDGFGTGWSSMARLSQFPWDLLKINRSFIATLADDAQAEHVVRAMVVMAHALGIRTVAEGVETQDQLDVLASLDCDVAQGSLFTPPLSARDAITRVTSDGRWHRRRDAPPMPRTSGSLG